MQVLTCWVLRDRNKYLREWTTIGPRTTTKLEEALKFDSHLEAVRHPAFSFTLTSFEPIQIK